MALSITEAEKIVARELGSEYSTIKVSGYWIVLRSDLTGPRAQSRSLSNAIAQYRTMGS